LRQIIVSSNSTFNANGEEGIRVVRLGRAKILTFQVKRESRDGGSRW